MFILENTTDQYVINLKSEFSIRRNYDINDGIVPGTLYF